MKTKFLLLALVLFHAYTSYAHAQEDELSFPTDSESIHPSDSSSSTPPPMQIDESDSSDVSDVEEYDG